MINIYCLLVFAIKKDLHQPDFVFVIVQSVTDLLFTGIFGLLHYSVNLTLAFRYFCSSSQLVPPVLESYQISHGNFVSRLTTVGSLRHLLPCNIFPGGLADPDLRWTRPILPLLQFCMETYPHWSHCLLNLGIAIERFILICYPTQ